MNLPIAYDCAFKTGDFEPISVFKDEKSGIVVHLGLCDTYQIVQIDPSNNVPDWITDFKFHMRRFRVPGYARHDSPIRVHSGYLDAWEKIRDSVLKLTVCQNMLVTGFSMGGGLSSIIAVDIQYNCSPHNLICVDFDGPKVWNKAGRDSYNHRVPNTIKIVNGNDIVTKIPPFCYHGGKTVHIGNMSKFWKFSVKDHIAMMDKSKIRPMLPVEELNK
jgi:hypothetical protein